MIAAASFSRSEAWNSPSAEMTFARRSRSASACRAIARCMPAGISTSLTSTTETLIPQGDVASSMIVLQDRVDLVRSREELVEHVLAEHGAQRRLRDLRRRDHVVLDLRDRRVRLDDPEVRNGVHGQGRCPS